MACGYSNLTDRTGNYFDGGINMTVRWQATLPVCMVQDLEVFSSPTTNVIVLYAQHLCCEHPGCFSVYGINYDGVFIWNFSYPNLTMSPFVTSDDNVILCTPNELLFLDIRTGAVLMQYEFGYTLSGIPAYFDFPALKYTRIAALYGDDTKQERLDVFEKPYGSSPYGLYSFFLQENICCPNKPNVETNPMGGQDYSKSSMIFGQSPDILYYSALIPAANMVLLKFNLSSGAVNMLFDNHRLSPPTISSDGNVYVTAVGDDVMQLVGYNNQGQQLFFKTYVSDIFSSPVIPVAGIASDGLVAFLQGGNYGLYMVNGTTGDIDWCNIMGPPGTLDVLTQLVSIGRDGTVYAPCDAMGYDGLIQCVFSIGGSFLGYFPIWPLIHAATVIDNEDLVLVSSGGTSFTTVFALNKL